MTFDVPILILARGGSKRIKNKNIIDFCGKPLINHAIEKSLKIILWKAPVSNNTGKNTYRPSRPSKIPEKLVRGIRTENKVISKDDSSKFRGNPAKAVQLLSKGIYLAN